MFYMPNEDTTHFVMEPPKGGDIHVTINVTGQKVIDEAKQIIKDLGEQLDAETSKAKNLEERVAQLVQEVADLNATIAQLKTNAGASEPEIELSRYKETALREVKEFKMFLISAQLNDVRDTYESDFIDLINAIRDGYRTVAEAITQTKYKHWSKTSKKEKKCDN